MATIKKRKEWTRDELVDLQKQLDERKWYQGEEWWCDPSSIMNYCEGCVNKAASGCRASQAEREAFTSCALNYVRLEEERKKAELRERRKARAEEKKKRLAEEAARLEAERLIEGEKVDRRFLVIEEETSLSQNEAVDATTGETVEVVPAAAQITLNPSEKKKRGRKKKSKSKKHYVATVEEFELDV